MDGTRSAYPRLHYDNGHLGPNMEPVEKRLGEFKFFVREAKVASERGPVLELASGAGRILMVLAAAGIEAYGLEASPYMIALAKKAISQLPEMTQRRIHIIQGDMCCFAMKYKFPLVIVPFHSFWFNFGHAARAGAGVYDLAGACLRCILEALTPSGRFIIDTPDYCDAPRWWDERAEELNFTYKVISPYSSSYPPVLVGQKEW